MALDPKYITDGPLEESFLDKDTGLPLAGGTITFYRDSSRITPKPVYQLTGSPPNYNYIPLPNPITLSSIGTVQNAGGDNVVIYYYPWEDDGVTPDLYYVVVRDSNGVEQFTREAWPNGAVDGGGGSSSSLPVQNQMSNPQFTQVLINDIPTLTPSTTTFTVSGSKLEFDFAPNWTFVINGTGDVVVERLELSGSLAVPTNAPYAISVSVGNGISTCYLRQRFNKNSGLWTSTPGTPLFISSGIVVRNLINVNTDIEMFYQASNGLEATDPVQILSKTIPQLSFYTYYTDGSPQIPISTDANSGEDGYVDIYISFTPGCLVEVTSVQVVPVVNVDAAPLLPYDVASANRAEALMGDYYLPRVSSSPLPSLLVGWDFPLNPAQFGEGESQTASTTCDYMWDQTICLTSSSTVAITRNSATGAISLSPAANDQSMYLLQYLSGAEAKEMLYTRLSSNVDAWLGAGGGQVSMTINLYRAPAATAIPTLPSKLVEVSSTGVLSSLAAGWTEIPRSGLDTARGELFNLAPNPNNDMQFTGWEIVDPAQLADTDKFAIVVTLSWTTATPININSISLNKGDLPARPAPKTKSDVLSECQYYYEKTKNPNVKLTDSGSEGSVLVQQFSYFDTFTPTSAPNGRSFGIQYKIAKRVAPTVKFYSVDGTADNVRRNINTPGGTNVTANILASLWTAEAPGVFGSYYRYTTAADLGGTLVNSLSEVYITFHYEADARLGKI